MKLTKAKFSLFLAAAVLLFFLSNDFGLIDIEKTAIITAVAIDFEEDEYLVNAQVAVPEPSETNNQNVKAQISGRGATVGGAIKDLGDLSGWYPKLDFCNLIIIGSEIAQSNVIKVLDYFSKTLRIQDSAVVVQSEKTAKEILEVSTPLDNISSFALQKVLLKSSGFNRDVAESDIKDFVEGYYSDGGASFMPVIKIIKQDDEKAADEGGNNKDSGEKTNGNALFDASSTALFNRGIKVGELSDAETLVFNMLTADFSQTTLNVNGVYEKDPVNFLLTVQRCDPKLSLVATENSLDLNVSVNLYCKISDQTKKGSDTTYDKNPPLPLSVKENAEAFIKNALDSLIQKEKSTGCDFLKLKEKLYRRNFGRYSAYKDNFISVFDYGITVNVEGQK